MKIIIAPDKFKNSITGLEFCSLVEKSLNPYLPKTDLIKLPLADGGDGSMAIVNHYLKGTVVHVLVNDPLFRETKASYLFSKASKTAFIETAEASGIKLLKSEELNCLNSTTYGTGELIKDAINKGVKNIILGIGGTASNDCGIGMASALGYQFVDKYQNNVKPIGANLAKIKTIDDANVMPKLKEITFTVACDVVNPLFGENGAACVYAAQKGATKEDIAFLDKGLQCFAQILTERYGVNVQSIKGGGAAGGLGIASKLFLKGTLKPGVEIIKRIANFDEQISNADWIITGEGKLDHQTLSGKTIQGVLTSAKKQHIKVAAFCGSIDLNQDQLSKIGITYSDDIMGLSNDFEDALQNTNAYMSKLIDSFAKKFIESTRFNNK